MCSQISSLVTTRLGPVAADTEDARVAGSGRAGSISARGVASLHGRFGHDDAGTSTGCSRNKGWPGATGSPSSTSHSITSPPCGATTG